MPDLHAQRPAIGVIRVRRGVERRVPAPRASPQPNAVVGREVRYEERYLPKAFRSPGGSLRRQRGEFR